MNFESFLWNTTVALISTPLSMLVFIGVAIYPPFHIAYVVRFLETNGEDGAFLDHNREKRMKAF